MASYIARRILLMIPTLLGILLVSFIVVQFAPGGPVERVLAQLSGADTGGTSRISGSSGGDMVARGQGRLLLTSSIASTIPGAFQAVYNASKSFIQSFAQALQNELKDSAVTITSLMPGPTDTEFFDRAGMSDTKIGQAKKDDPAQVAEQGLDALLAGKSRVTGGGLKTRVQDVASKVVPDKVKAAMHRSMAQPGSGD